VASEEAKPYETQAGRDAAMVALEDRYNTSDWETRKLQEIYDLVKDLDERCKSRDKDDSDALIPMQGTLARVVYDLLRGVGLKGEGEAVAAVAEAVADLIEEYAFRVAPQLTEDALLLALSRVRVRAGMSLQTLAHRIERALRDLLQAAGSDEDEQQLKEALELILALGIPGTPQPTAQQAVVGAGTPSSEVVRDASHLTTLLLGSSPAFAEAMRLQSDAMASSLAAFNKVSDAQRHDGLNLAILARSADATFRRD
jgi:hypothetical protein